MTTEAAAASGACIRVGIVGGGIAGLYCAYKLQQDGRYRVTLYEARDFLGGRIETERLDGFNAEFGPMRFEESVQPLFGTLCETLNVSRVPFSPPQTPSSAQGTAGLRSDEVDPADGSPLDALNLFRLGIFKMILGHGTTRVDRTEEGDPLVVPADDTWLPSLSDSVGTFDGLRRTATLMNRGEQPLWKMGLWVALENVLSSAAIKKIAEDGTFYHLIPQNPNAIEWAIFWLRVFQLRPKEPLSTIPDGVITLVDKLREVLRGRVDVLESHRVESVTRAGVGGRVRIAGRAGAVGAETLFADEFDEVILALPRRPLLALGGDLPADVRTEIDRSVVGFALLKVFFVARGWLWHGPPQPQQDSLAVRAARELHYFIGPMNDDQKVLVLVYTDEPDANRWRGFVRGGFHDRPEIDGNEQLVVELIRTVLRERRRLIEADLARGLTPNGYRIVADHADVNKQELLDAASEAGEELTEDQERAVLDLHFKAKYLRMLATLAEGGEALVPVLRQAITTYGIRDWSREPFGAGCHAWQPGVRSWIVRERFAGFSLNGVDSRRNVHICGEAFSDYQGFIEGALRSAVETLVRIMGREQLDMTAG